MRATLGPMIDDMVDEVEALKRRLRVHLVVVRFGLAPEHAKRLLEWCRWRQELADAACLLGAAGNVDPLEVVAGIFPAP